MIVLAAQMPTRESLIQFEKVFTEFAKPAKVEASSTCTPTACRTTSVPGAIRKNPNGPNPSLRSERFSRWMDIMIECGRARLAAASVSERTRSVNDEQAFEVQTATPTVNMAV